MNPCQEDRNFNSSQSGAVVSSPGDLALHALVRVHLLHDCRQLVVCRVATKLVIARIKTGGGVRYIISE